MHKSQPYRGAGSLVSVFTLVALGAACSSATHSSGFAGGQNDDGNPGAGSSSGNDYGNPGSGSGSSTGTPGSLGTGNTDAGGTTTYTDGGLAGDGPIDTTPPCDTTLARDDSDPASFARAMGICTNAATDGYGLVSAAYSNAWGSTTQPHAGQWGFQSKYGNVIVPREGQRIGVLSSGYAREYDDLAGSVSTTSAQNLPWGSPFGTESDFVNSSPDGPLEGTNYPTGTAPPGFPQQAQGCPQSPLVNDMIDVKLTLQAPPNATGFSFDFDFYSSEWPNFVCSDFNDAFVAYVTSNETTGNVSFDSNNNPIAVNVDFFNRCTANAPLGCLRSDGNSPDPMLSLSTCMAGVGELGGTGFADTAATQCGTSADVNATLGGATGWLTTTAPIKGGEMFTIDFMVWDSGDGELDSLILLDHFQWIGGTPVMTPTTQRPPQ